MFRCLSGAVAASFIITAALAQPTEPAEPGFKWVQVGQPFFYTGREVSSFICSSESGEADFMIGSQRFRVPASSIDALQPAKVKRAAKSGETIWVQVSSRSGCPQEPMEVNAFSVERNRTELKGVTMLAAVSPGSARDVYASGVSSLLNDPSCTSGGDDVRICRGTKNGQQTVFWLSEKPEDRLESGAPLHLECVYMQGSSICGFEERLSATVRLKASLPNYDASNVDFDRLRSEVLLVVEDAKRLRAAAL